MIRREFLRSGAATAALAAIRPRAFAASGDAPLRVALIGCGWYGKTDLFHLLQVTFGEVVALCDVDRRAAEQAAELVSQRQASKRTPPLYGDYRKLLAEHQPEIVLVGTPDHWHALPMIAACEAGADVYVQKPISVDVAEGQAMVAAARRTGSVVQVGLQRRSTPHLLEARDKFLRSGRLGRVGQVEIHSYYGVRYEFPPAADPPAHLDWDAYVGPAPWVDYRPGIHPRAWRSFREFSNGQTGDLCVHLLDLIRYFLDLGWPERIAASGDGRHRPHDAVANVADTQTATFSYPDLDVVWTQRSWGEPADREFPWAATIFGDQGMLKLSVFAYEFTPYDGGEKERRDAVVEPDKFPEDKAHKETELFAAVATRRHMRDFLEARRAGREPVAAVEQGHISSASCILANLSMDLNRELRLDAKTGAPLDDDEAIARLARPYRSPWTHPGRAEG